MELLSSSDHERLKSLGLICECLDQADLEQWFDHVAQAFPLTGRGYFVDHFKCVPDLSSILVIKTVDKGRIVSTMRLFEHKIVLGSGSIECAGVGEVSTKLEWRQKGLAKMLLKALEKLALSKSYVLASLHTSQVDFYSKFGFRFVPIEYATATVDILPTGVSSGLTSPTPISSVTPEWRKLHELFCLDSGSSGCVDRSQHQWSEWIPREVQRQCGIQNTPKPFSPTPLDPKQQFNLLSGVQWQSPTDSSKYAIMIASQTEATIEKAAQFRVREFFASDSLISDTASLRLAFESIISHMIPSPGPSFVFKCPGILWRLFIAPSLWTSSSIGPYVLNALELANSDGIMYKELGKDEDSDRHPIIEQLSMSHIFFSLDGF